MSMNPDKTQQSMLVSTSLEVDLTQAIGLGVAGNFTGHLEQAGEASDFVGIQAATGAPKGVFPFYVPSKQGSTSDAFIHMFPLSANTIMHPIQVDGKSVNLQIEPEIGLLCELNYGMPDKAGKQSVVAITPTHFGAYNDCSIRKDGAKKISEKKNWGLASKGFAIDQCLPIDIFAAGGVLDNYRLVSFLKRDDRIYLYGEDSAVSAYGYMYGQLIDWLIEKLNRQQDIGPLENLAEWLHLARYPRHAVISIGATRYTAFGESTYLQSKDEAIIITYDQRQLSADKIEELLSKDSLMPREDTSILRQKVKSNNH